MTTGTLTWREPRAVTARLLGGAARLASHSAARVKSATLAGYRFVPAAASAGLISAGIGMRLGAWAGLIAGGVFCAIADARMP